MKEPRWCLEELAQSVHRLFDRLREYVTDVLEDRTLTAGLLGAISEQERAVFGWSSKTNPAPDLSWPRAIHQITRYAGFVAGVMSYLPVPARGPRGEESCWYHVHTVILDCLDARGEDQVDCGLLAILEVARGEICEAYRLVPALREDSLPSECRVFFDALDLAILPLAARLGSSPAAGPAPEEGTAVIRSKYSGAAERYPIDLRTCVLNDVRRYFRVPRIVVPDRIFQAVRATYHESIEQLCPEDVGLFAGLLLATPALALALRGEDFFPEAFLDEGLSFAPDDNPAWGYAWTVSLRRMFFDDADAPTEVAERTAEKGEFGVFELLDGILESMSRPWGHAIQSAFAGKCIAASPALASGEITREDLIRRIRERSRIAQQVDPAFAWQQLGIYLDDHSTLRATPFSPWSAGRLSDWSDESREERIARTNVQQTSGWLSREVLNEFEWLLGRGLPERDYQQFLERHPEVLLSLGPYTRAVPHVVLHQDDGRNMIPDFFLEVADRRGADLLELKRPDARVDLRWRAREGFRAEIHHAVNQLRAYRDWFDSASNRRRLLKETGLNSFRPRAILVFGRSSDFQGHVDRLRLESGLPPWVKLSTYDELLTSAREWISHTARGPN